VPQWPAAGLPSERNSAYSASPKNPHLRFFELPLRKIVVGRENTGRIHALAAARTNERSRHRNRHAEARA
jgi:hypothetical protein